MRSKFCLKSAKVRKAIPEQMKASGENVRSVSGLSGSELLIFVKSTLLGGLQELKIKKVR